MMAGNFNLQWTNSYDSSLDSKIGTNSAVIDVSEAVKLASWFIAKVETGDTIEGVSSSVYTYTSDNQTAAKAEVVYRPVREWDQYRLRTVWTALVFDAALVTSNTINLTVNGTAMTQITFATNNDTTLSAIATQLATQFPTLIATAVRSATRTVVITTVPWQTVVLASITVAAWSSQAGGTQATYFTDANVGKYFDIDTTTQYASGITQSTSTGQVRLEQAESQSFAIFSIANI